MNTNGFLDIDGSRYVIDETISQNPKLQKFILDSGADVMVTNDAMLIQNLHEFSNLILTDSGGREHRAQGRGTIEVGGHTLTCYHAPTLTVSVVSVRDFKDLGEDTLFRANGNVYVTNHGSQTFKLIGKEGQQAFQDSICRTKGHASDPIRRIKSCLFISTEDQFCGITQ